MKKQCRRSVVQGERRCGKIIKVGEERGIEICEKEGRYELPHILGLREVGNFGWVAENTRTARSDMRHSKFAYTLIPLLCGILQIDILLSGSTFVLQFKNNVYIIVDIVKTIFNGTT